MKGVTSLWTLEPAVVVGLLFGLALYTCGVLRLWGRAGVGRGIQRWRALLGVGAFLVLGVALISPLEALSGLLFSAHMVQHLLIMIVAAPLLVLSLPVVAGLWALPTSARKAVAQGWLRAKALRNVVHTLTNPVLAWTLFVATFWVWHTPGLYEAALRSNVVHGLEHLTFLATSLLFWWTLLQPVGHRRLGRGAAILYLFAASLQGGALGALITFSPTPWYGAYARTTEALGRSALGDQQLAGLLMWLPLGTLFTVLAGIFFLLWLRDVEARMQVRQHAFAPRAQPQVAQPQTVQEVRP